MTYVSRSSRTYTHKFVSTIIERDGEGERDGEAVCEIIDIFMRMIKKGVEFRAHIIGIADNVLMH